MRRENTSSLQYGGFDWVSLRRRTLELKNSLCFYLLITFTKQVFLHGISLTVDKDGISKRLEQKDLWNNKSEKKLGPSRRYKKFIGLKKQTKNEVNRPHTEITNGY